jgi:hypothetical protein
MRICARARARLPARCMRTRCSACKSLVCCTRVSLARVCCTRVSLLKEELLIFLSLSLSLSLTLTLSLSRRRGGLWAGRGVGYFSLRLSRMRRALHRNAQIAHSSRLHAKTTTRYSIDKAPRHEKLASDCRASVTEPARRHASRWRRRARQFLSPLKEKFVAMTVKKAAPLNFAVCALPSRRCSFSR